MNDPVTCVIGSVFVHVIVNQRSCLMRFFAASLYTCSSVRVETIMIFITESDVLIGSSKNTISQVN